MVVFLCESQYIHSNLRSNFQQILYRIILCTHIKLKILTLSTQLLCIGFLSLDDNCDDFIGCKMPFSSFRCSASLLRLSFGDLAQSEKRKFTITIRSEIKIKLF